MSKLPIKDPRIRLVPSKSFRQFVAGHFSQESALPDSIRNICKNNLIESKHQEDCTVERLKYSENEVKFLKRHISERSPDAENDADPENVEKSEQEETVGKRPSCALTLTLNDLRWLHQATVPLRRDDPSIPYIHELIQDCQLLLPENEIQERNVELEARCEKLRKEQEAREYQMMTRNVDNIQRHMPQDTIAFQMKQINKQLIAVAQFIFSVAAGFAFGFIGIELIVGQLDFGFRLLLGIMIALIVALAEIYFLAKKLNEEYDIANQQQTASKSISKETPKVVESIRVPSKKMHED